MHMGVVADKHVVLIGMRGCGKSSVGRSLAEVLRRVHIDTDQLVIERAGQSIREIFETQGEAKFRAMEADAIAEVVGQAPVVISVGGGAVVSDQNARLLKESGIIVWLTAPVEILWERIQRDQTSAQTRPALTDRSGLDELAYLFDQRRAIYERWTDVTIATEGKSIDQVVRDVCIALASRDE